MGSRELHPLVLVAGLGAIGLLAAVLHLGGLAHHPAQQLTALGESRPMAAFLALTFALGTLQL